MLGKARRVGYADLFKRLADFPGCWLVEVVGDIRLNSHEGLSFRMDLA
jgi:hypothetical protein